MNTLGQWTHFTTARNSSTSPYQDPHTQLMTVVANNTCWLRYLGTNWRKQQRRHTTLGDLQQGWVTHYWCCSWLPPSQALLPFHSTELCGLLRNTLEWLSKREVGPPVEWGFTCTCTTHVAASFEWLISFGSGTKDIVEMIKLETRWVAEEQWVLAQHQLHTQLAACLN